MISVQGIVAEGFDQVSGPDSIRNGQEKQKRDVEPCTGAPAHDVVHSARLGEKMLDLFMTSGAVFRLFHVKGLLPIVTFPGIPLVSFAMSILYDPWVIWNTW